MRSVAFSSRSVVSECRSMTTAMATESPAAARTAAAISPSGSSAAGPSTDMPPWRLSRIASRRPAASTALTRRSRTSSKTAASTGPDGRQEAATDGITSWAPSAAASRNPPSTVRLPRCASSSASPSRNWCASKSARRVGPAQKQLLSWENSPTRSRIDRISLPGCSSVHGHLIVRRNHEWTPPERSVSGSLLRSSSRSSGSRRATARRWWRGRRCRAQARALPPGDPPSRWRPGARR